MEEERLVGAVARIRRGDAGDRDGASRRDRRRAGAEERRADGYQILDAVGRTCQDIRQQDGRAEGARPRAGAGGGASGRERVRENGNARHRAIVAPKYPRQPCLGAGGVAHDSLGALEGESVLPCLRRNTDPVAVEDAYAAELGGPQKDGAFWIVALLRTRGEGGVQRLCLVGKRGRGGYGILVAAGERTVQAIGGVI